MGGRIEGIKRTNNEDESNNIEESARGLIGATSARGATINR